MLAFQRTLMEASGTQRELIDVIAESAEQAIAVAVERLILRADPADDAKDLIMSALWMHAAHGHLAAAAAYDRFRWLLEATLK